MLTCFHVSIKRGKLKTTWEMFLYFYYSWETVFYFVRCEIDPSLFLARARRRFFSGPWDHGGVSEGEVHKSLCSSKISASGTFHSKTQPLKMHQNYDLCSLKDPRKINVQLTGFCFCFCFSCQKKGSKDFQALPVSDLKPEVHESSLKVNNKWYPILNSVCRFNIHSFFI